MSTSISTCTLNVSTKFRWNIYLFLREHRFFVKYIHLAFNLLYSKLVVDFLPYLSFWSHKYFELIIFLASWNSCFQLSAAATPRQYSAAYYLWAISWVVSTTLVLQKKMSVENIVSSKYCYLFRFTLKMTLYMVFKWICNIFINQTVKIFFKSYYSLTLMPFSIT